MDYLIENTTLHSLKISRSEGAAPLIYVSTNHRTFSLDEPMARQLVLGLRAVLDGGFDRALSEIALQLELEELEFRNRRAAASQPSSTAPKGQPVHQPELDLL